jgi:hypothetical protein
MTEELVADRNWAEIPYFRKPWFMVLLFLVFMPAYLLVIWTGDTYYRKQGVVYRMSRKRRITMTLLVAALMLSFFMRQFR